MLGQKLGKLSKSNLVNYNQPFKLQQSQKFLVELHKALPALFNHFTDIVPHLFRALCNSVLYKNSDSLLEFRVKTNKKLFMVIFDTIDAKFYKVMSMKIHILMSLFVKLKEIFTNFKKFGLFFGWYDISLVLSVFFFISP